MINNKSIKSIDIFKEIYITIKQKSVETKNLAINHSSDMGFWGILQTLYKNKILTN